MRVEPCADRARWESFLTSARPPTFLQSWAWGETQRALGEDVIRLAAVQEENITGVAQAVTVTARRGKFLHLPHGPVVEGGREQGAGSRETTMALLTALRDEAKRRGLAFLRVSPIQENTPENRGLYRALHFRDAPIYLHSENVWVLDLVPSEEELLAGMRKTTRNLVRRAERENVHVTLSRSQTALATFRALYAETAQREVFVPFSRRLLEAELAAFGDEAVIGIASHNGKPLAGALAIFTPWSAFYHHGASTRAESRVPATYALQWALIREAKRRGCPHYNFWGIYSSENRRYGITVFKTGFGGRKVSFVPTKDLPLTSGYWPVFALDTIRRWKRGLS